MAKLLDKDPAVIFLWSWLVLTCATKFILPTETTKTTTPVLSYYIINVDVCIFFCLSVGGDEWDRRRWTSVFKSSKNIYPWSQSYSCSCSFFTGTCIDSLNYNRGAAFSTKDKDSDIRPSNNCAVDHQGAWWYKSCTQTNLNGLYNTTGLPITGIYWYKTHNKIVLLKRVEMKLELVE